MAATSTSVKKNSNVLNVSMNLQIVIKNSFLKKQYQNKLVAQGCNPRPCLSHSAGGGTVDCPAFQRTPTTLRKLPTLPKCSFLPAPSSAPRRCPPPTTDTLFQRPFTAESGPQSTVTTASMRFCSHVAPARSDKLDFSLPLCPNNKFIPLSTPLAIPDSQNNSSFETNKALLHSPYSPTLSKSARTVSDITRNRASPICLRIALIGNRPSCIANRLRRATANYRQQRSPLSAAQHLLPASWLLLFQHQQITIHSHNELAATTFRLTAKRYARPTAAESSLCAPGCRPRPPTDAGRGRTNLSSPDCALHMLCCTQHDDIPTQ